MKAMILAAGEGSRLHPLTLTTPKPLLPINGVPLIEHTLLWLKSHAITEVAINLHHLGKLIQDYLGNGSAMGMSIAYSEEGTLLGTAGGVKKMEAFFDESFVVIYGDMLTNFNLSAMIEYHREVKSAATLAVFEAPNPHEVGIVDLDNNGQVLQLIEKPDSLDFLQQSPALANGGIYILEQEILNYIPQEQFYDFAYDVFPEIIKAGLPVYGYPLPTYDSLIDIGTLEKYYQANSEKVLTGHVK